MNKGTLYFVGVPIGNYNDITLRALDLLKKVDLILCEDTRETIKLLDNFLLKKETISYVGSFNLAYKKTVEYLNDNKSIAFVSDRGMPSISDPGAEFLTYFRNIKTNIKIIPGVSSVTTAFSLSGNSGNFYFYGFMPRKTNDIIKIVQELLHLKTSLIFFESPYRINKTLEILSKILGDKSIKICRELTKIYEEIMEGTCEELKNKEIKGEIVLII